LSACTRLLKEANGILEDYDDQRELEEQIGRLLDNQQSTGLPWSRHKHIFQPFEFIHVKRENRADQNNGVTSHGLVNTTPVPLPKAQLMPDQDYMGDTPSLSLPEAQVVPSQDYNAPPGGQVKVDHLRRLAVDERLTNASGKFNNGSSYQQGIVIEPLDDNRRGQEGDGKDESEITEQTPVNRQVRGTAYCLFDVEFIIKNP